MNTGKRFREELELLLDFGFTRVALIDSVGNERYGRLRAVRKGRKDCKYGHGTYESREIWEAVIVLDQKYGNSNSHIRKVIDLDDPEYDIRPLKHIP